MTDRGEAQKYLTDVVMAYDGDECLPWPFALGNAGYGVMKWRGRRTTVSRIVCELVNGHPPTPLHQAAHSCGKGHEACCAKRHLSWKTPAENAADKVVHGTLKLSPHEVQQIREIGDAESCRSVGKKFGICPATVHNILRGKRWAWLAATKSVNAEAAQ